MNSSKSVTFKDLKNLNMDLMKEVPWAEEMFKTLEAGFKKSFLNWLHIVFTLSLNEDDVIEWKTTYMEQFEERCCEMVSDIQDLREQVIVKLEGHLSEIQNLCKTLKIEMPLFGCHRLGLYQEQLYVKKQLEELKQMARTRKFELDHLQQKQLKLCKTLGKEPKVIKDISLISTSEILDYQVYIEDLEHEKFNREEKFYILKEKICDIIKELEYVPANEFERDVILKDGSDFFFSESNMRAMEYFYSKLEKQLENVKEEIGVLRKEIEQIRIFLDCDVENDEFRSRFTGNSLSTLEALRHELQSYEQMKEANMMLFIEKLRRELNKIWKQCHCSESIKNEFKYFYSDCYTNDILEFHEIELEKWKTYASENNEILNLLNKHKNAWEKLMQLEISSNGIDRYNNRGGKLLKEEKERNKLSKQISKIETKLMELSEIYEHQHGKPFLTFEQTVESYINNMHAEIDKARKLKLSSRKLEKGKTLTTNSTAQSTSASFNNNIRKIAKGQLKCSSTAKKQTKPTAPNKPMKKRYSQSNIPKILVTSHNRSVTLNTEKKMNEKKRTSRQSKSCEENSSYVIFENEISSKENQRSTLKRASSTSEGNSD